MASNTVKIINNKTANASAQQRTGAILPLTVILLVVLVGMVAFAIDLGYLALARTEIQAAADSSALAASLALEKDNPSEVRLLAHTAAQANAVAGSAVAVRPDEDVELGYWDSDNGRFTALTGTDQERANSVRVTCRRTSARGNPISLFFAPVLGVDSGDVSASAIAHRRPICGTFIGIDSTELSGTGAYSDSYNSDLGPYENQTPGNKGHLCSNGPINVQNGAVHGNAIPGPGHSVSVGSQGSVTGNTTPRKDPLVLPPVDFGDVMTNNDNDLLPQPPYNPTKQRFRHNDSGMYLPGGTYYFTEFSVTGGPIIVHQPVTIYVNGDVSISGNGVVNVTHSPSNLRIYAVGKYVKVSGDGDFRGVVYAPTSDVVVSGGGSFFGGAVGETLKLNNSGGIHADESVMSPFPARSRLVD